MILIEEAETKLQERSLLTTADQAETGFSTGATENFQEAFMPGEFDLGDLPSFDFEPWYMSLVTKYDCQKALKLRVLSSTGIRNSTAIK